MDRQPAPLVSHPPPQFTGDEWSRIVTALRLSPQQANIVGLIMQGRRDKQIARDLHLSPATVRTHLRGIFARLDVQDRVELVLRVFATSSKMINQEMRIVGDESPIHSVLSVPRFPER
jgi:DNA-binding NarL/FixJ family response regulator